MSLIDYMLLIIWYHLSAWTLKLIIYTIIGKGVTKLVSKNLAVQRKDTKI